MDEALRAELLEMERVDRAVRADLVARGELHRPGYHPELEELHRRHNARMRAIIDTYERRRAVGLPAMAENESRLRRQHRQETSIMDQV